jgi:cell division protein ZapA (FtsZ GTPase activity inhibitor)
MAKGDKDALNVFHVLLQDELDRRFREMQRQMDQRFKSSDKAVAVAQAANEKRLDNVNEFRQTLADQTKSFVTQDKFEGLAHQVDLMVGQQLGDREKTTDTRAQVTIAISVLVAIIAIGAVIVTLIIHH